MNPLWTSLYDSFKDRRYAALFLVSLFAIAILPILLPIMVFYGLSWTWSTFRLARENRRNKWRHVPLSRDEWRVARSKLMNGNKLK